MEPNWKDSNCLLFQLMFWSLSYGKTQSLFSLETVEIRSWVVCRAGLSLRPTEMCASGISVAERCSHSLLLSLFSQSPLLDMVTHPPISFRKFILAQQGREITSFHLCSPSIPVLPLIPRAGPRSCEALFMGPSIHQDEWQQQSTQQRFTTNLNVLILRQYDPLVGGQSVQW